MTSPKGGDSAYW